MDSRKRAVPVLLALGFTWGCSFLFIKACWTTSARSR
jgi:hypothetical protein